MNLIFKGVCDEKTTYNPRYWICCHHIHCFRDCIFFGTTRTETSEKTISENDTTQIIRFTEDKHTARNRNKTQYAYHRAETGYRL